MLTERGIKSCINSDSSSVWKGMKYITSYKTPSPSTVENQQMADDLNEFYCRFEKTPFTPPATPLSSTPTLQISEYDVRQVFKKNKRRKAPGPDGVSPACLKTCADQLCRLQLRFNTIIPDTLQNKLTQLSILTSVCQWITSFLTDRQHLVRLGKFLIQHPYDQHWSSSGLCSLLTALLPLHERLHI